MQSFRSCLKHKYLYPHFQRLFFYIINQSQIYLTIHFAFFRENYFSPTAWGIDLKWFLKSKLNVSWPYAFIVTTISLKIKVKKRFKFWISKTHCGFQNLLFNNTWYPRISFKTILQNYLWFDLHLWIIICSIRLGVLLGIHFSLSGGSKITKYSEFVKKLPKSSGSFFTPQSAESICHVILF